MKIGDKAISKLHKEKGVGVIIGIDTIFDEKYVDILFDNGEIVRTKEEDISFLHDPIYLAKNRVLNSVENFFLKNFILKIDANVTNDKIITSTNFKIKPLPHQILTVNFSINRLKPRCLIADEVGLGKTIEAALVYEELKLRGIAKKVLIIAPSGLVIQWQEELFCKFNEEFVIFTKPFIKILKESHGQETNVWKLYDRVIVSIDSVKELKITENLSYDEKKRREWHNKHIVQDLIEAEFDMVIIDEAHKLSKYGDGTTTARYKLAHELSQNVPILLLLTATPHQGKSDLFLNLLKLIDPYVFGNYKALNPATVSEFAVRNKKRAVVDFSGKRIFKKRIPAIVKIERDEHINKDEISLYNLVTEYTSTYYNLGKKDNQLYSLLMILYQRMASSSSFAVLGAMKKRLEYLNEDFEHSDYSFMDNDDEDIDIDKILKGVAPIEIDAEISFLKKCIALAEKITSNYADVKFKKLIEIIDETIKREEKPNLKFIVFTEFKETQKAIIKYLETYGYKCSFLNGDLSREEKIIQIEAFRTNKQILVSTDAGGEGINLQFCYCMINFDLPWNPSRLEQRIGRIDRIGQKNDVLIFNFHLVGTVEDRVRKLLEDKLVVIKQEFGEDKYADVLTLLDDEFSFDKLYIEAIILLEKEEKFLDKIGNQIYSRAKEILEHDEILLPFTNFDEDAGTLLNKEMNRLIEKMVYAYLKRENIPIEYYKDEKLIRFKNPFTGIKKLPSILKYVTFDSEVTLENPKADMINLEHPFFKELLNKIKTEEDKGLFTAISANINKFHGKSGFWFVYRLEMSNNANIKKVNHISVFMENETYCNDRISMYLDENLLENYVIIHNFESQFNIELLKRNAFNFAEIKSKAIFEQVRFDWINKINQYKEKLKDYMEFKRNAIMQIKIDNIRHSQLKSLDEEYKIQLLYYNKQGNITPKLTLYQIAYLEFC